MKFSENSDLINIVDDIVKILITKRNLKRIPKHFSLKQIHSDKFYFISNKISFNKCIEGDGIITDQKNLPIGIRTADCLGILIYSKKDKIIGAAHCGWRSTANRLIEKMIEFLINEIKLKKENITIILSH